MGLNLPWTCRSRAAYAEELEDRRRGLESRVAFLGALVLATSRRSEVTEAIAASADPEAAAGALQRLLGIDRQDARAVLDLQLRRFTQVEVERLTRDRDEARAELAAWDPSPVSEAPRWMRRRRGWMSFSPDGPDGRA